MFLDDLESTACRSSDGARFAGEYVWRFSDEARHPKRSRVSDQRSGTLRPTLSRHAALLVPGTSASDRKGSERVCPCAEAGPARSSDAVVLEPRGSACASVAPHG